MCEGQNHLSALSRSRRSINPGGSLTFLALCLPFLVWKSSRAQSLQSLITAKDTLPWQPQLALEWKDPLEMPLVPFSGVTLLHTDPSFLMSPAKMRKCPPSLNVNVFGETERDTKGWEAMGKRMLLTFPFGIGIAESHWTLPSSAFLLGNENQGWKRWLSYGSTAAGNRSLQTACSSMCCGKTLQYLYYLSSAPHFPSLLSARPCSLLLGGLVHPALCLASYSRPSALPSAVFKQPFVPI